MNTPAHGSPPDALAASTLAMLVSRLPWAIGFFARQTEQVLEANKAFLKWFNPEAKIIPEGRTLSDIFGVAEISTFQNRIIPHLMVFGSWQGVLSLRDIWGSEQPHQLALLLLQDPGLGECYAVIAAPVQTASEAPNQISDRELLHALLDSLPERVYFKDLQSRFLRVNAFMAKQLGSGNPADFIGHTDFDYFAVGHARAAYEDEQRIIQTGQPVLDLEEKQSRENGLHHWITTSKFPLRDRTGKLIGTFGISRDITARRQAEADRRAMEVQLHLHQKLESVGRLASGVAHEINTPAQFITDNIHFIKKASQGMLPALTAYRALRTVLLQGGDPAAALAEIERIEASARLDFAIRELPQTIEDALEGLTRVSHIVRSLKEFSHPGRTASSQFSVNRCVETTLSVSRHEWKYVADVETDLTPDLPSVVGNSDEFNQVLLNLIVNAAHAIKEAQKVQGSKDKGRILITTSVKKEQVVVSVQDTGHGIPEAARSQIFEPFFTTKEVGQGSGQGLAICRSVVHKHGGTISFETEVGRGTTFIIHLPLAAAAAKQETSGQPET